MWAVCDRSIVCLGEILEGLKTIGYGYRVDP